MQKNNRNDYDVTKGMLKTIRTLTESKTSQKSINEQDGTEQMKDNTKVINDVDVKLISSDKSDMELKPEQETVISSIIDNFRQQVSQLAKFEPGFTFSPDQVRLDGNLPDEDLYFVLIAGKDAGAYINAEMMKLEQNVGTMLEKIAKFQVGFEQSMDPIITQRDNNI